MRQAFQLMYSLALYGKLLESMVRVLPKAGRVRYKSVTEALNSRFGNTLIVVCCFTIIVSIF